MLPDTLAPDWKWLDSIVVWCLLAYDLLWLNSFPHTDAFWRLCNVRLLKTLWQKEKLLKTSNLSFCYNVFNFFSSNYTFIFGDFPWFCLDVFKVVCCGFVVCGKGLIYWINVNVTWTATGGQYLIRSKNTH